MPDVVIRDATLEDLAAIVEIHNEGVATTDAIWTEQPQTLDDRRTWFEARAARGFPVLVADIGGSVVGFASYGDFRDTVRTPGYLGTVEHSVHVSRDVRGRGIGPLLLRSLLDRARDEGVRVMIGAIDGGNHVSLAVHQRLGFVEVARLPGVGVRRGRVLDLVLVQRNP